MDVKQSSSRAEAEVLVASCLDRWDLGGRDQLHAAFLASTPTSDRATFANLLTALLTSHVIKPRLALPAFSAVFRALCAATPNATASPEASTSRAESPSKATDAVSPNAPLVDAVLDVIWVLDAEIDARKELAAGVKATLFPGMEPGKGLAEQTTLAKTRLADVIKELIRASILSRLIVAERLEVSLLRLTGLVEDETLFTRKGVRMNTANLYKQQKFNLLREENEGYAGLINELVGGMGPAVIAVRDPPLVAPAADAPRTPWKPDTSPVRVLEQESSEERNARARKVMGNVSALIGYFDLDPNRVVDIIMDVFSTNVVGHWPFFLALLAASPWGPDRPKRAKKQAADASAMDVDEAPAQLPNPKIGPVDMSLDSDVGNNTIAQLLGFKFGLYQSVDAREETPEDLYVMSALLIREGYVRFADLFPHLTPDESGISKLLSTYRATLTSTTGAAPKANALTMAAPLASDGYGAGSSSAAAAAAKQAEEAAAKEPPNQVAGLLKALLAVGQLKHALFILGRYPWMCGSVPGVAELYGRLLRVILEPACATISLAPLYEPHPPSAATAERNERESRRRDAHAPPPKLALTTQAPEPVATVTTRQVFFYPAWRNGLPAVQAQQLLAEFLPLLRILGVHLARDSALMQQVARLSKIGLRMASSALSNAPDSPEAQTNKAAWIESVRSILLPALSCTTEHERVKYDIVDEVWLVIYKLPYAERFALYGEWKYDLYRKPELKARQLATERQAKGILKRISADNVRESGRQLASAAQGNPTVFFTVALNQIQSYENLIPPIVECAKYLNEFGYDVFTFILLDALSNPEKERTKSDGTNISLWLKSLASFAGTVYRRFKVMDVGPVLQYMANQLQVNNVKDLVLVRELVLKMAGIEPLANLADNQIHALTGGRLLRREAMMVANAGIGSDARQAFREGGERLLKALEQSRMTVPLLILIAQQHQSCTYLVPEAEAQPKYMGNLYDTCQETLFQYVEYLHNQLSPAQYAALVPSLKDLCTRFGIDASIAFHIARPRLHYALKAGEAAEAEEALKVKNKAIAEAKAKKAEEEAAAEAKKVSEEVKAEEGDEKAESTEASGVVAPAEAMDEDTAPPADAAAVAAASNGEIAAAPANGESGKAASPDAPAPEQPKVIWRAAMREAIEASEEVLPEAVKALLGPHFHATFWQLALSDLTVPAERYEQEQKMLAKVASAWDDPRRARQMSDVDREMRNLVLDSITDLKAEYKAQTLWHFSTRKRLATEKDHWFANATTTTRRNQLIAQLLQYCVLPRALLSPTDALFAARFIKTMHLLGTRSFSSLTAYDKIFTEHVASTIFFCTENEARNYSRFLLQILSDLAAWHKDEALYKKEAISERLPGFQMKWGNRLGGEAVPEADLLGWAAFKQVTRKWHTSLAKAFKECLVSKEYMRIRNAIVVLTKLAPHFPMMQVHGVDLLGAVQTLATEEKRGDLKVLGQGLLAVLKKRQPSWIKSEQALAAAAAAAKAGVATQSPAAAAAPAAASSSAPAAALPTGPKSAGLPNVPVGPRGGAGRGLPQSPRLPLHPQSQQLPRGPSGLGPSQPGVNGGAQQQLPLNGRNTPTGPGVARPAVSRVSSSSLPARPARSNANDSPTPHQAAKTDAPQREPEPAAREPEAPSSSVVAASQAARQAVVDSMNPPKKPADTASAVAARERGGATRSGNATPSHDRVARDEPADAARPAKQEPSRDSSPSRGKSSRAGSPAGSAHSTSKSQSSRARDGNDDADRDRSSRSDRDRGVDRVPDMYAGRRERERERGSRDDSRRAAEPSSRSSDRSDRDSDRRSRDKRHERSSSSRHESSRGKDQDDTASSSRSRRNNEGRDVDDEPSSKRRHREDRDAEGKSSRSDAPPSGPAADRAPQRAAPEAAMPSPTAGQKRSFSERSISDRLGGIDPAASSSPHSAAAPSDPVDAPDSKRVKIKGSRSEAAEAAFKDADKDQERDAPQVPRSDAPQQHRFNRPSTSTQESSGRVVSIRGMGAVSEDRAGSGSGGRGGAGGSRDSSSRASRNDSRSGWGDDVGRSDGPGRRRGERQQQRRDRRQGGGQ